MTIIWLFCAILVVLVSGVALRLIVINSRGYRAKQYHKAVVISLLPHLPPKPDFTLWVGWPFLAFDDAPPEIKQWKRVTGFQSGKLLVEGGQQVEVFGCEAYILVDGAGKPVDFFAASPPYPPGVDFSEYEKVLFA